MKGLLNKVKNRRPTILKIKIICNHQDGASRTQGALVFFLGEGGRWEVEEFFIFPFV
jgi:hypothetical protein